MISIYYFLVPRSNPFSLGIKQKDFIVKSPLVGVAAYNSIHRVTDGWQSKKGLARLRADLL